MPALRVAHSAAGVAALGFVGLQPQADVGGGGGGAGAVQGEGADRISELRDGVNVNTKDYCVRTYVWLGVRG